MNKSRLVRQLVWFVIAAAFPLSYAAGAALNPQFYSLRIADTGTLVPGGSGQFKGFDAFTANAFIGTWAGGSGVYARVYPWTGPTFVKLADTSTAIPGGTGTFTAFSELASDGASNFSFVGSGAGGQQGIYTFNSISPLKRYVDLSTPIPGGTGNFVSFGALTADGRFYGEGSGGQKGVYTNLKVGADIHTAIPGRPGVTFDTFAEVGSGYGAFFRGGSQSADGVYAAGFNNFVGTIADSNTVISSAGGGRLGPIYAIGTGYGPFGEGFAVIADPGKGVYHIDYQGVAHAIALSAQLRPDGSASFGDITSVGFADGTIEGGPMVFFDSVNTDSSGIYFSWLRRIPTPQPIERLIGTGDLLDGKTLASVSMTDSAVFSYSVTFRADFVDGSSGIYTAIAYVPEPSSLVGVVAIGLFVRARRRRSKRCQPPFS